MRRLLVLTALAAALTAGAQQRIVRLWNNASAPHDNGLRGGERVEEDRLFNTTEAVLYVYAADPARATGQAAVVCPGGGYHNLAIGYEGHDMARWLADHGTTAAVLKYRMPNGHCEVPRNDAEQALRIMREHAAEWGYDAWGSSVRRREVIWRPAPERSRTRNPLS
jgi:acetyl esterase/lipase